MFLDCFVGTGAGGFCSGEVEPQTLKLGSYQRHGGLEDVEEDGQYVKGAWLGLRSLVGFLAGNSCQCWSSDEDVKGIGEEVAAFNL